MKNFEQPFIVDPVPARHCRDLMNRHWASPGCKSQERFRLRFQRRLLELLARGGSVAEAFGPAWEVALDEFPLDDAEQARVYWPLIEWARGEELFTGARPSSKPMTPQPVRPQAQAAILTWTTLLLFWALTWTNLAAPPPSDTPIGTRVWNGIDLLLAADFAPLQGLKIGLITNHTGTDRQRNSTIDLLRGAPGITLTALFSPEHGIRGALDRNIGDSVDQRTGLPIYSLYGERRAPSQEQLCDLDALVFDIQDIGCRFYTYISTLGNCLEAAARARIKFMVLDRVNPITGSVDGPVLTDKPSFIAFHPIPVRHGMTVGELARMCNVERHLGADLTVVPVVGWSRGLWFDATGLPWTNPSPNMRSLTEATLYPGVGLLEMTNVSVGRGTGTPFEVVGAPYIDDVALAAVLNQQALPGVRFVPIRFTPTSSVFKDQVCPGVSILLTDREHCDVVDIGMIIAQALHRLYPAEFGLEKFNRLLGHPATVQAIRKGASLQDIRQSWAGDLTQFALRRKPFLLYPF